MATESVLEFPIATPMDSLQIPWQEDEVVFSDGAPNRSTISNGHRDFGRTAEVLVMRRAQVAMSYECTSMLTRGTGLPIRNTVATEFPSAHAHDPVKNDIVQPMHP